MTRVTYRAPFGHNATAMSASAGRLRGTLASKIFPSPPNLCKIVCKLEVVKTKICSENTFYAVLAPLKLSLEPLLTIAVVA